jgi:hypothetical protein
MGIQREMVRVLSDRLRLLTAWLAVDSEPITTAESPRWKSARVSIWPAEAGWAMSHRLCAAKQRFFLGFRLHLLVSNTGAICDFVLSPAHVPERRVARRSFRAEGRRTLVRASTQQGGSLIGDVSSPEEAALRAWHRGPRTRIESVFASLADQFRMQTTRARSIWGVMTRVAAKLLGTV